ncbi:SH3 domain-containing protein [Agrobacterium fabrum]|uniref:SH3 domain-containing protein n=1 Tax=Agrobacterium fabrum TaxID=1176649 RepID=A0A7Z7FS79_9HYPH|nr:SH3 domain-containing protein [Agrobacterium fabrum]SDK39532.1 SH3 domain-containing protein [Agrobacterium fabrum]
MSAPYRNFWIIVAMMVGATVFANISSKPEVASGKISPGSSHTGGNASSGPNQTPGPQTSAGVQTPSTTTDQKPPSLPTGMKAGGEDPPVRQFRSIDNDIKQAFDTAIEAALAQKIGGSSASAVEAGNAASPLPSLTTKEVKSTPGIADAPSDSQTSAKVSRTTTNLNMRRRPDPNSPLIEVLPTGLVVTIVDEQAGWVQVLVKETGQNGWVNARFLTQD